MLRTARLPSQLCRRKPSTTKYKDTFVLGENISQTASFVVSGSADIGIVALSLALSPKHERQLASLPAVLRTQKCKDQYSARDFRSALARQPCQPSFLFWWDRLRPPTHGLAAPRPSQSLAQGCRAGTAEMGFL